MFMTDVQCECGHIRTVMLKNSQAEPDDEDATCPECGGKQFTRTVGGNWVRSNDPEVRSAMLKKRSEDHSRAHFKDNLARAKEYTKKRGVNL
jgi:hypothetical protein